MTLTLIGKSWKTHPKIFLKFPFSWVVEQAVLLENSSIRFFWLKPFMICNIWSGWVFQLNGLFDDPENGNSRKISGWVFHDLPIRVKTIFIGWSFFYSIKGNDFKNQLRTELTRLRHCKGRDCSCSIDRGGITGCGESGGGVPAGLKPTAKGNRNRISG